MNTAEIACVLRRALITTEVQFTGVFAADMVPRRASSYPTCFVVNTDPASKPGEHWVACYASSPKHVEFFDSYGMPPYAYKNIQLPYKVTTHNTDSIQCIDSSACGQYCIYYLRERARGQSMPQIVKRFKSMSGSQRERHVRSYFEHVVSQLRIRRPCVSSCAGLQCCVPRRPH
jgi:hypothetical protein